MFGLKKVQEEIDTLRRNKEHIDADWRGGDDSPLLRFYVKVISRLLDAERCSLFIVDTVTGRLWLKCSMDVQEHGIEVNMTDDSVVGRVVASGKPVMEHGLENRPGAHKAADAITGFQTRSILCVPIMTLDGQRVAGAAEVLNKKDDGVFTDEDLETLEEATHFLQHAIESIYYHQETLDTLSRVKRYATYAVGLAALSIVGMGALLMILWLTMSVWDS
jgi:GAF domain-containing protein